MALPTMARKFTHLLDDAGRGDRAAIDALVPLVYDELRTLASEYMRREGCGHTLQTTALINEAYLRLAGQEDVKWANRAHFLALAATSVRRILIDHARRRQAAKRGNPRARVQLDDVELVGTETPDDLLAVHNSLQRLEEIHPRKSKVVELRFFAGLDIEATAKVLDVSTATVERDWRFARAWLHRELEADA